MFSRVDRYPGITACRRASLSVAGSLLAMAGTAQAGEVVEPVVAPDNAAKAEGEASTPGDVIVNGSRYRINTLNSRLPDVRDAPQSISIIPKEVIEQQSASTLRDVLRNVSGISMAAGEGGGGPAGDNLTLRGFGARNDIFVDGIRDFASYARDTFNVEQVEVVKGPASAQTGRGSTGGYINLFSKQPENRSFSAGTLGIGAPTFVRATGDLNLAGSDLGIGGGTAFRFNTMVQKSDTPGRDYVENKRFGLAPSLAVGLGSSTRAILSYTYLRQDNVPDYGIPFVPDTNVPLADYANQPAPVDYDNYYGLLDRDYEKLKSNIVTFALEQDIGSALRVANTTRYGHATRDSIYSAPRFASTTSTDITAQFQSRDTVDTVLLNQSNLFAKFGTGGLEHDLIAGLEISREKSRNQLRTATAPTVTDLFDPDPTRPYDGVITDTPGGIVRARADTVAAYLFDTIEFSEALLFSGGVRYEHYKSEFEGAPPAEPLGRTDKNLTWRAGVTVKPVRHLSLYAGAGTSVNPSIENMTQTTPTAAVVALKPERSRTFEVGAKYDGFDGKLLLTGALFRTDKFNARTPGLAGEAATVLEGKQRVDGVEFGLTGRLNRDWNVIAAYTYLDSEVRESNTPSEIGNRLANVPNHSGSVWTTYKLPFGVEVGSGVRYVGMRYTNVANIRRIDSYWVGDATIAYDVSKQVTLRLNGFNLTDKRYIDQVGGGHFVPGPGRSVLATISFRR
ncbi:TonB-dependent siderophore receptor [Sphingomonas rhizophila]|uniref:TonB-dependent siderophore receptor n=1 Tax=Sphingomonas rhizophila TaxID=2071607 RepID=A0A7G9S9N3_9SPHN|nr:TonB-dependent siderophore receptor [Sphingomonas rhizophila]QNN64558.1 TonB-dependent siderophore receptor [Sphingomonas rhizophila]